MDIFKDIVTICAGITSILALVVLFFKPLREKIFNFEAIREGQKCMLRADMLRVYYKHLDEEAIHQHEYENFVYEYNAYKALKGNSFIENVKAKVDSWSIIP